MRSRSPRVPLLLALSLGFFLMLLNGCSVRLPAVQTSLIDGEIVFRTCEDAGVVDTLELFVAPLDDRRNVELAWKATGDAEIPAGTAIVYGDVPAGMETTIEPHALVAEDSYLSFALVGFRSGVRTSTVWRVDGSELHEGVWLNSNGTEDTQPCLRETE